VADASRPRFPWFLVVAGVLLAVLLGYTLFFGYLPAKQRIVRLERELKDLYAREAELQVKQAQNEQRHALRDRQLTSITAERDAVTKRLDELEREIARGKRR
jgi:type II secretory pathway component PulM